MSWSRLYSATEHSSQCCAHLCVKFSRNHEKVNSKYRVSGNVSLFTVHRGTSAEVNTWSQFEYLSGEWALKTDCYTCGAVVRHIATVEHKLIACHTGKKKIKCLLCFGGNQIWLERRYSKFIAIRFSTLRVPLHALPHVVFHTIQNPKGLLLPIFSLQKYLRTSRGPCQHWERFLFHVVTSCWVWTSNFPSWKVKQPQHTRMSKCHKKEAQNVSFSQMRFCKHSSFWT